MHKLPLLISSLLLAAGSLQARADEVTLTTALAQGETLQLALNADLKAELTWGNGDKVTLTGSGQPISLEVKDSKLTITSTKGKIVTLYVQGDKLTALNVTAAPNLKYLYAADNQLTQLNLSKCTELVALDVQGNQFSALTATTATDLTDINVADNNLTRVPTLASTARPEHYVAANNQISTAPTSAVLTKAKTLWLQGNKISTLTLSASKNLRSLAAADNSLTKLTLADMPLLKDLSLDGNQLTALDLSKGSASLYYLSVENNALSNIEWDGKTARYIYLGGNALFFNSFPTLTSLTDYTLTPQSPYDLGKTSYDLNTVIDLSDILNKNGWGQSITNGATYTVIDGDGKTLVKDTDYTVKVRKFTFLTGHAGVSVHAKVTRYPNIELYTSSFNVGVTEGIEGVKADAATDIHAAKGGIIVNAASPLHLTVVSTDGRTIYSGTVQSGTTTIALPQGVYLANGKKLIVS